MFLLRRKSDNKFFINRNIASFYYKDGHYHSKDPDYMWTDDILKCVPFKRKCDAMQCRGIRVDYPRERCPIMVNWSLPTHLRELDIKARNDWYKEEAKVKAALREEKYEVIEVEVRIKNSNEVTNA
jgi:hypothetical protein